MRRIMRAFKIAEISGVDKPAQAHARAVIMKRNDARKDMYGVSRFAEMLQSIGYMVRSSEDEAAYEGDNSPVPTALRNWLRTGATIFNSMASEEISELMTALSKRTFSASERRRDARSGAAESDGSFPIENATDLRNAMRAVGRSKNPEKTKAHIRARARALGLTSMLSDAFKSEGNGVLKFLGLMKNFGVSKERLSDSLISILEDEKAANKAELVRETIDQFSDAVEGDIEKAASEGISDQPSDEEKMLAEIAKALGLAETASDEDIKAALAKRDDELAKAKEVAETAAKAGAEAELRKAETEKAELAKRVAVLEEEREMAAFRKRAEDIGVPADKADVLRKAVKGDVAAIEEVFGMLKTANAAIEEGAVFKEFGSSQPGPSDEMAALEAKAAELRKADPKLTKEQAFAKVYSDPANAKLAAAERRKNRPVAA